MPEIVLTPGQEFSLDQTLGCGQVFRWDRGPDGWWRGVVESHAIRIRQDGDTLAFSGAPAKFVRHYFALDLDLEGVLSSFDRDPFIREAIERCKGLRIVRQPQWECLISYICATNSNIPTIRRRIAAIAGSFGTRLPGRDGPVFAFPSAQELAGNCEDDLTVCRLGYRQPYIFRTACMVHEDPGWETRVASLPYEEARKELMRFPGIGPKAADCILLFGFGKYEAFPVDVWIRRIMQHYTGAPDGKGGISGKEYNRIRAFAKDYFGDYCGYAQEYLYAARG
jgi:N-glycosylase/DNA lyase